ncbi:MULTISPECIES: SDR family NAD(P)-dependent oxidoreductase [Aeromicrobium]|uniref:SDR family NAD(P)-dependent oxidoreductase n=1 Tax=Aeromicrobium TaxID=2040 RepID=UPI00257E1BDE|nr:MULTISPECIES: SDR family oxidoreductase [Aeromicrobium]
MPADPHAPRPVEDVDHTSLFRLDGQHHAVIGAGAGIGEHVATTITALGGRVLCVDIDGDGARAVGERLGAPWLVADATTPEGVARIGAAVDREWDRCDGYVDVIGQQTRRRLPDFTLEDWDRDFRVNVLHAFLLAQELMPRLVAGGGGAVVHLSSTNATLSGHHSPGYGPAKAALEMWVRELATQYGPAGVRVNAVAPGLFLSPRFVSSGGHLAEQLGANTPLRRLGQPHEVAATVAFLLTPAAGYVTGAVLPVEGGLFVTDPSGLNDLTPAD